MGENIDDKIKEIEVVLNNMMYGKSKVRKTIDHIEIIISHQNATFHHAFSHGAIICLPCDIVVNIVRRRYEEAIIQRYMRY